MGPQVNGTLRLVGQWAAVALLGLIAYLGKNIYEEQQKRSLQVEVLIEAGRQTNNRLEALSTKVDVLSGRVDRLVERSGRER